MQDLKRRLKEIIVTELRLPDIEPDDIADEAPLFGEGIGLDSLDAVELVVLVQKKFGVQIADMDEGREAFRSVKTLADFIQQRQAEGTES